LQNITVSRVTTALLKDSYGSLLIVFVAPIVFSMPDFALCNVIQIYFTLLSLLLPLHR